MSEAILNQCQCESVEDTGDGFVVYRRNEKGEEEVHILNQTAYEIFDMCMAKPRSEIMEYFRLHYNLDAKDLALVARAMDDMIAKGIISAS